MTQHYSSDDCERDEARAMDERRFQHDAEEEMRWADEDAGLYPPCGDCGALVPDEEHTDDCLNAPRTITRVWTVAQFVRFLAIATAIVGALIIAAQVAFGEERDPVKVAKLYVNYDNVFNDDGANWCADFVVAVFGDTLPVPPSRSARALWNAIKAASLTTNDPQPGDLIFFWRESPSSWKGHVGLVERVSASHVWTIEGNVGGKVVQRMYNRNAIPKLLGFGAVAVTREG